MLIKYDALIGKKKTFDGSFALENFFDVLLEIKKVFQTLKRI